MRFEMLIKIGLLEFKVICVFTSVLKGRTCFKIVAPKGLENYRIKMYEASELAVMIEALKIIDSKSSKHYVKWAEDYQEKGDPVIGTTVDGVPVEDLELSELDLPEDEPEEIELSESEQQYMEAHSLEELYEYLRRWQAFGNANKVESALRMIQVKEQQDDA